MPGGFSAGIFFFFAGALEGGEYSSDEEQEANHRVSVCLS